ncbi:MAG TPA: pullulanase-type alpha-1,6-glucosidase, partial [Herpetosiphonaceae bacterium]|nr:pullulanase-type alpha-1,6-glucosidase [Herpetosiphonaceae bacterium]
MARTAHAPNPWNVTIAGTLQSALGCPRDWQPDCSHTALTYDPVDDLWQATFELPAGEYEYKVALNNSWDENYGAKAEPHGANISLKLAAATSVRFIYDHNSHCVRDSRNGLAAYVAGAILSELGCLDIRAARAHWVTRDTILWKVNTGRRNTYRLHYDPAAALRLGSEGITGGKEIALELIGTSPPPDLVARFPHLRGHAVLRLKADALDQVPAALQSQLAVSVTGGNGNPLDATGIQIPGVLDDLFTYDGPLGVSFEQAIPTLRVWAPTAQSMALHLFDDSQAGTPTTALPMMRDAQTGVWSITGNAGWTGKFYLYEVKVFAPSTGAVETNLVTDPYSISLATNSRRSQLVDLSDAELMPPGWAELRKPDLAGPEDIVLYELHVRDFSIFDASVPEAERGTFKAFTHLESNGMRHLRALAEAGLTHIHLLPVFDIATVDENKAARREPNVEMLRTYPPDSTQQQALVAATREEDGFNWGYDPFHYTTPEGSYATEPDGTARIREFREMVQALNDIGLCVVMDVVYNHTTASGQNEKSVLDRAVPGYYHRLNQNGEVETSTCCQNTATEHAMMEKLMVDSLVTWARAYKIDGFRFDLMGHHMLPNMVKAGDRLRALTLERDGVDGSRIYVYGEGWDFGEVANNARGANATQINMAGTGIGTFNDRLRDAVRGGSAFGGIRDQGFATGQWYAPNEASRETPGLQKARLLLAMDQIRVGLAGNLRDYRFMNLAGHTVPGREIPYNGRPTGYTSTPHEVITYVEAHDNETFWDAIQLKAPITATLEQRVRMHNLGTSLVCLGQGIPFFQAGQDMLRSKSLDRNSYNSGDWFNRLDFTYESNNWGAGLPPGENKAHWPLMRTLLGNPALKPGNPEIMQAVEHFREMLQIRASSRLFRLPTAEAIQAKLRHLNTGPDQIPGLIVMSLSDREGAKVDEAYCRIIVLFNATFSPLTFASAELAGTPLELHPVQAISSDAAVRNARFDAVAGVFTIPAQT